MRERSYIVAIGALLIIVSGALGAMWRSEQVHDLQARNRSLQKNRNDTELVLQQVIWKRNAALTWQRLGYAVQVPPAAKPDSTK